MSKPLNSISIIDLTRDANNNSITKQETNFEFIITGFYLFASYLIFKYIYLKEKIIIFILNSLDVVVSFSIVID